MAGRPSTSARYKNKGSMGAGKSGLPAASSTRHAPKTSLAGDQSRAGIKKQFAKTVAGKKAAAARRQARDAKGKFK